jgi:hypothetical protein
MCNSVKPQSALTSRQLTASSWQLIKRVYCRLLAARWEVPSYALPRRIVKEDYLAGVVEGDSLIAKDFIFWIRVFR